MRSLSFLITWGLGALLAGWLHGVYLHKDPKTPAEMRAQTAKMFSYRPPSTPYHRAVQAPYHDPLAGTRFSGKTRTENR